ncbi:IncP plasmid survival protein KfrC family protein [Rhodoferax sp.]|uniref:IncP plasmid survival protein KfrC family protein n=1 Tax=Rhodoferax sp. TaxID=50421 RepID=UPI00263273FF|nr:IncP plasmid survival protein KfrC family protein [Rhodoferax sp.]MDD2811238.1 hypothetical protein [Rhodoferax sp.]MDD4942213.1 hypothetical protein [Rhodoferax sp.]MDD5481295.1 hypothetical protein [Rhodoferax sp.]
MIQSKESQATRPGLQLAKPGLDAVAQADALLERAQEAQAEQTALLEASPLESQYSAAFAAQVEAKHDQAERIEDRLENLIEQQASRLQQTQASQPGLFSRPGARAKWQSQIQQQQSAMQRLHGRLEAVREIKDGMGAHGPRIEELAHRKVRAQEPGLAKDWEEMREAERLHQALLRKQEQEKKQALERERRGENLGRGLRLGLTQA